ncbi:MAG: adenylate/guanylate cyclase domain-containing protein [Anaerolineae bacterium]|jgi:predicted ATPase/class 3 adenylate cyclase
MDLTQVETLRQAVAALEAQRATLGDVVVDTAIAPLREKLALLEQQREPRAQERRLVTIMFVDIVRSTEISQGLEPEETLELMQGALARLAGPITAHGGHVTRYMGDGLMAVFGLETTREKDAVEAVRAGLELLQAIAAYNQTLRSGHSLAGLDVRVGINTGVVALGGFSEKEHTLSGLPVNLAARLEQAAPPGGILISDSTLQQVHFAFDVDAQAPIRAKGFHDPVPVYLVRRAKPRTFRTISRTVRGVETEMVGREAELQQLQGLYQAAMEKQQTHRVTLVGEAGVGKSRLLYEFDRWLAARPVTVSAFKGRAGQQMMDIPFGLLRELLAYRFGILASDPVSEVRQKLEDGLAQGLEVEPRMKAHFVGALLGYDFSQSPHLLGVQEDSKQLRERALFYLDEYITAVSGTGPTVLLLEDSQWGDEPSLDAVSWLARTSPHRPLLIVCVARPSFLERHPAWGDKASAGETESVRLTLQPLSQEASHKLVSEILQDVDQPLTSFVQQIVDIAEGNPFFLEELIKVLLSDGVIIKDAASGAWQLDEGRFATARVPSTVTSLLQARLNRLPLAQRILLQQASVVGRTFWSAALQMLAGLEHPPNLELDDLVRHELVYHEEDSTFAQSEEYRFKHSLMRDVVFDTIPKRIRQAYHSQAAAWLIEATQAGGRSEEFTPVIAVHYDQAGARDEAVDWYLRAGDHAQGQGAPADARRFFGRALELLPDEDLERHWSALIGRETALLRLGELEACQRDGELLVSLALELQDEAKLAEAYRRQGYARGLMDRYAEEMALYEKGLAAARQAGSLKLEAVLLGLQVPCLSRMGKMQTAAEVAEQALACAEESEDEETLLRNLTNVAFFHSEQGDPAQAAQLLERQVTIIQRLGNREGESVGLSNLGYNYVQLGLYPQAVDVLERSIAVAASIGYRLHQLYGCLNLGLARVRGQDLAAAQQALEQCEQELETLQHRFGEAALQSYRAMLKELDGDLEEARRCYTKARGTLGEIGAPAYACDALAGQARCELALGNLDEAQAHAEELWRHLLVEGAEGMEFPILAYETCADVFEASGDTDRAQLATDKGYDELMERAGRIDDPEWRTAFLSNVPEHERLLARWIAGKEQVRDEG